MKIGFIGVGVMGNGMVKNLLKNGYSVAIYTRTKARAAEALEAGAQWRESVRACVSDADLVITIVGFPKDVEEVYFGPEGVLENLRPGARIADMTTTSPKLAEKIYRAAKSRGISALDAPVSGGDTGARAGTLAIMVGGDRDAFDACLPVFEAMGKNVRYEGPAGFGQHTKMANQIAIAGALAGVCEAVAYAKSVGLDAQAMLDTISTGAAGSWQMTYNAPKMLREDYSAGFYIKHYIKDMRLAAEESRDRARTLPVLEIVLKMFEALAEDGHADEGTQALIRAYMET